jgi:hypothetical protein
VYLLDQSVAVVWWRNSILVINHSSCCADIAVLCVLPLILQGG